MEKPIKFWYGGVKHTAANQKEQDDMIAKWQSEGVDPYEGLMNEQQRKANASQLAKIREQQQQIEQLNERLANLESKLKK